MRRRTLVAWVVAAVVCLAGAARAQSRDPGHWQVLVQSRAQFKNLADLDVDIAVNDPGGFLNISRTSHVDNPHQIAADRVRVQDHGHAFDVFANRLDRGRDAVVDGAVTSPVAPPVFASEPLVVPDPFAPANFPPSFPITCGTDSRIGGPKDDVTLPPGPYGTVTVGVDGILRLGPGTYNFCSLVALKEGTLSLTGPVTINVRDLFLIGTLSAIVPVGDPSLVQVNVMGPLVRLGTRSRSNVRLFAPKAKLRLGADSSTIGRLVVRSLVTDARIHLSSCGNGVLDSTEACDASAAGGDAACPGACVAPGQPNECTCGAPPSTTTTLTTSTTVATTTTSTATTTSTSSTTTTATTTTLATTTTVATTTTTTVATTTTATTTPVTTTTLATTTTVAPTTTSSTSTTSTTSTTTSSTATTSTVTTTSTTVTSTTIACGDASAPECNGLCPNGDVCTLYVTDCVCVSLPFPCGIIDSPVCAGQCPDDMPYCVDNAGNCECSATP